MIHQRKLDMPCPLCSAEGTYGALFVAQNHLVRGCVRCNQTASVPLPTLRKTVLYLDQCFLSSAYRAQQPAYVERARRIRELASRQLLVCPWSSVHETETHQWPDAQQQALWDFIKRTAGGHKFNHSASIQHAQLSDRFRAFLKNDGSPVPLDLSDAFAHDVHAWDGLFWVDVRGRFDDSATVKQSKVDTAKQMSAAIDGWRANPQTFAADVRSEWSGYAKAVISDYARLILKPDFSDPLAFLTGNAQVVNSLMIEQDTREPIEVRFERVQRFLLSEWFATTPFVDISCRLMATLRRAVRRGELATREKAERAMYGFGQDMEMVSVFAPYVDAVFMDRTMHRWITEPGCALPGTYGFRAFSVKNWAEFDAFLDDVERRAPPDHAKWVKVVYG